MHQGFLQHVGLLNIDHAFHAHNLWKKNSYKPNKLLPCAKCKANHGNRGFYSEMEVVKHLPFPTLALLFHEANSKMALELVPKQETKLIIFLPYSALYFPF